MVFLSANWVQNTLIGQFLERAFVLGCFANIELRLILQYRNVVLGVWGTTSSGVHSHSEVEAQPMQPTLFQVHPSQVAHKEVVTFTPGLRMDDVLAEADRRLAKGESLMAPHRVQLSVLRCG